MPDDKSLKSFFDSNDLEILDETEEQIFVHVGINEDNDDLGLGRWKTETSDYEWKGKFPPTFGSFYKDVIAGHVYTHRVADNLDYLGRIYHDGENHHYIDGDVERSGIIPILVFDTDTKSYHYIEKESELRGNTYDYKFKCE